MAKIKTPKAKFRKDILRFQDMLGEHFAANFSSFSELSKILTQIDKSNDEKSFRYADIRLQFLNPNLGKTICPSLTDEQCKNATIDLILSELSCEFDATKSEVDPIKKYQIQLILKVKTIDALLAKNSWHFEKHPDKKDDGSAENTPEFLHPLYHLHFGGYEMTDDDEFDFGKVLIIDSPRIMHPPMDIILAIDFVIKNFYSCHSCEEMKSLIEEPDYNTIVNRAKETYWKPFAFGLAANFCNYGFQSVNHVKMNHAYSNNLLGYSKNH